MKKSVIFKNCAPFIIWISKLNNTEIDYAQNIDIVMLIYNLLKYRDNYLKTYGSLWQYYKDKPNYNSESFKSKVKVTGITPACGNTKDVKIIVTLKYLSIFWRNLEMSLINCEVSLFLTWSSAFVITNATGEGRFTITDTRLYIPVVTLSTQNNARLLSISDPKTYTQSRNLNLLLIQIFKD